MGKQELSVRRVSKLTGQDAGEVTKVNASKQSLTSVGDLIGCKLIQRLDVSQNSISDLDGVSDCCSLLWLNASHNQLSDVGFTANLSNLTVLNLSHNQLAALPRLSHLTSLKALILNDNQLTSLPKLSKLKQLNTLVLSRNQVVDIPRLPSSLSKLSASSNQLTSIPDLHKCSDLIELRLNSNQLTSVGEEILANTRLFVVDIGKNQVSTFDGISSLRRLKSLRTFSLQGNAVCAVADYADKVKELLPQVHVFDGRKRSDLPHLVKTVGETSSSPALSEKSQSPSERHQSAAAEDVATFPHKSPANPKTQDGKPSKQKEKKAKKFTGSAPVADEEDATARDSRDEPMDTTDTTPLSVEKKKKSKHNAVSALSASPDSTTTSVSRSGLATPSTVPDSHPTHTLVTKAKKRKHFDEEEASAEAAQPPVENANGGKKSKKKKKRNSDVSESPRKAHQNGDIASAAMSSPGVNDDDVTAASPSDIDDITAGGHSDGEGSDADADDMVTQDSSDSAGLAAWLAGRSGKNSRQHHLDQEEKKAVAVTKHPNSGVKSVQVARGRAKAKKSKATTTSAFNPSLFGGGSSGFGLGGDVSSW